MLIFPRQELLIDGVKIVLESSDVLYAMSKWRLKHYTRKVQTDIYKFEWLIKSQRWPENRAPMAEIKEWLKNAYLIYNEK